MDNIKYAGIDLHQSTCIIAIHNQSGRAICEEAIATEGEALRSFFSKISGSIHAAFEIGTQSAWLYEILKPVCCSVTVADVRKHKRRGSKTDRIDAHQLANLLRKGDLQAIYQGNPNIRRLRDLAHTYLAVVADTT
jgi:Transposase